MFTKKTRVLSALLTVCMVISLLAGFAVPTFAVAEEPKTGLVDTSDMIDLNTVTIYKGSTNDSKADTDAKKDDRTYGTWTPDLGIESDNGKGTKYKITDRKGLEVLVAIVSTYTCTMMGNYIYLANDIDMEWSNFPGIGLKSSSENGNYAFKGTFDGNGFVIKNFYMNNSGNYRVGLFNFYYGGNSSVIRNVGIANGLIVGGKKAADGAYDGVASIVGESWKGTVENCWSAANVISASGALVGGIVGRSSRDGATVMKNCYFLGTVNNETDTAKYGLSGQPSSLNATASYIGTSTAASLNGTVVQTMVGYQLAYEDTDSDCPALTYYKGGQKVVQRAVTKQDAYENAWLLNKRALNGMWKVGTGAALLAANADTATYRLTVKVENMGISLQDPTYIYANAGEQILVPAATEGMTLKVAPEGFVAGEKAAMPAYDDELVYSSNKIDFSVVKLIKAEIAKYNASYFDEEGAAVLAELNAACDAILAEEAKAEADRDAALIEANSAVIAANMEKVENASLVITGKEITAENLAFVPDYSDYDLYAKYNTANVWGVSTKEDWIALTDAKEAVANYNIYIKNNIDFENTSMKPLCAGSVFNGNVYGMDHYFENILIQHSASNGHDGAALISSIGSGVMISSLGIKSGTVELTGKTSSDNWYSLAVFVGRSGNANAAEKDAAPTIFKCWAGKDVKLKAYADNVDTGYSTFVGRGGAHIDSCYSLVTLETKLLVYGAFAGWFQKNSSIKNSYTVFNGVEPTYHFEMSRCGMAANSVITPERLNNTYALGEGVVCGNFSGIEGVNYGVLPADTDSAELAYKLNQNYYFSDTDGSNVPERVYWTTDAEGNVVYGTADDQILRLTVYANGNPYSYYGKPGDVVDLDELIGVEGATYELKNGKGYTLEGKMLVMGYTDAEVEVTSLLTNALDMAIALYNGKDINYFADPAALELKLELVKEKNYVNQASVNKDAKDLVDLYVPAPEKAFPASYGVEGFAIGNIVFEGFGIEGNDAFPEVGVNNLKDLNCVADHAAEYTAKQTIVLNNDIDLAGTGFGGIKGLAASFDGCGHTIRNFTNIEKAFFETCASPSIKNVVFEGGSVTLNNREMGYLLYSDYADNILVENVTFRGIDVVGTGKTYFGMVIGAVRHHATLKNITIENCTVNAADAYNVGLLVGSTMVGKTLTMENIVIRNNTLTKTRGETGYLIGSYDGGTASPVYAKNLVIYGNQAPDNVVGIFYGDGFVKSADGDPHQFNVENAIVYGNVARELFSGRTSDAPHKAPEFSAKNVYTDNDKYYDPGLKDFRDYDRSGVTLLESGFTVGSVVYAANKAIGENTFALTEEGVVLATETTKVPVKVTFGEGEGALAFYTDVNGKLTGDTSVIATLTDCGFSVKDAANAIYTEDTNVIVYNHFLEGCVSHTDGEHTGTCVFCKKELTFPCVEAEGYPKDYSSEEIQSALLHKCSFCNNEWITDITLKPATFGVAESFNAPVGADVEVPVYVINDPGLAAVEFKVTFDADVLDFKAIEFADKTCEVSVASDEGAVTVAVANRYADVALSKDAAGNLFTLTFAAKADAANGETTVAIDFVTATDVEGAVLGSVGDSSFKLNVHAKTVGDFDNDGNVNTADATRMMQYLLGSISAEEYDEQKGDVNGDGIVDLLDVVELLRSLA